MCHSGFRDPEIGLPPSPLSFVPCWQPGPVQNSNLIMLLFSPNALISACHQGVIRLCSFLSTGSHFPSWSSFLVSCMSLPLPFSGGVLNSSVFSPQNTVLPCPCRCHPANSFSFLSTCFGICPRLDHEVYKNRDSTSCYGPLETNADLSSIQVRQIFE